jgi:Cu-Zn family superoxide dismutase
MIVPLALAFVLLAGCGDDEAEPSAVTDPTTETGTDDAGGPGSENEGHTVAMSGADGAEVGTVTLSPSGEGVEVVADLQGLEPGFHGFHIHDVGVCEADAADGPFTTAMGHFVGDGGTHGDHNGDMPSLYVTDDGTASLSVTLDAFTLEELTEGDGAAVMVHADPDNFANIPDRYSSDDAEESGPDEATTKTGDAGARAACGVVGTDPAGA